MRFLLLALLLAGCGDLPELVVVDEGTPVGIDRCPATRDCVDHNLCK
jgi:hypothetical protein